MADILSSECDEYELCGCADAEGDLHCMYCLKPPTAHKRRSLDAWLRGWPNDADRALVLEALGEPVTDPASN
jgi:hypothetical protein